MINLDPSIIDQDKIRKKRRKKLFAYTAAPIILLFATGLFLVRQGIFDVLYFVNYNNPDATAIVVLGNMQTVANAFEPYIAYYDLGTAYIRDNNGKKAEEALRNSLKNNPPEEKNCQVRVNLAYSIEMQADEAANKNLYDSALILYSTAEGVLLENNCASKQNDQKPRDEKAQEARERIIQKRGDIVSEMNGGNDGDSDNNSTSDTQVSEEQIEEMRNNTVNSAEARDSIRNSTLGRGSGGGLINLNPHW